MSNFYALFAGTLAYSWFELWNLASFFIHYMGAGKLPQRGKGAIS